MPQDRSATDPAMVRHLDGGGTSELRTKQLLIEAPMQVRLDDVVVATTMRTPGHDFELAVGFCHAEGLLPVRGSVEVRYGAAGSAVGSAADAASDDGFNVVSVHGGEGGRAVTSARVGVVSSSCGWCGSDSVDQLIERLDVAEPVSAPSLSVLAEIERGVRDQQHLFAATGAAHAAAAFDPATGEVIVVREDIGRHNAVDKIVGRLRLDAALPALGRGMWVSGRASFEIVQKAWAAGFGLVVSVSAPSALAVATARQAGITLVGVARADGATVYHQPD